MTNGSLPEPKYYVTAKLCEPEYEAEWKFLETEQAFVERKLAAHAAWDWGWLSIPSLGIFSDEDWAKYQHKLGKYAKQLEKYAGEVDEGVLPVKFAVYNATDRADSTVQVKVHVKHGRLDEHHKVPVRPARLDAGAKPWPKLKMPNLAGFTRSRIKITEHTVAAELSALGAHDGAGLVTVLMHLHTSQETLVTYEITSRNVAHETGEVELQEAEQTAHRPDSST